MSLTVLKDIRKICAGLNADEVRGAAYQDLQVGLMAENEEEYRALERFLVPGREDELARAEALRTLHRAGGASTGHFDFVLCAGGAPVPPNGYAFDPVDAEATAKAIVADRQTVELAIARNYPIFRRAVADRIIHRVSRENALF